MQRVVDIVKNSDNPQHKVWLHSFFNVAAV